MPLPVLREKLVGFVADHQAKVLREDDTNVLMRLENQGQPQRRRADRSVSFEVALSLGRRTHDESVDDPGGKRGVPYSTITVTIRPRRLRDRRREGLEAAAHEVIASLRSYLGATESGTPRSTTVRPVETTPRPWWRFW
jgi:hypothetical protein